MVPSKERTDGQLQFSNGESCNKGRIEGCRQNSVLFAGWWTVATLSSRHCCGRIKSGLYGRQVRLDCLWRDHHWVTGVVDSDACRRGPEFAYEHCPGPGTALGWLFQLGSGQLESVNDTPWGSALP
jgi:hypothetical protein